MPFFAPILLFVAHLGATIILNRKHFDFFISDKPLSRYHVAHPLIYGVAFLLDLRT